MRLSWWLSLAAAGWKSFGKDPANGAKDGPAGLRVREHVEPAGPQPAIREAHEAFQMEVHAGGETQVREQDVPHSEQPHRSKRESHRSLVEAGHEERRATHASEHGFPGAGPAPGPAAAAADPAQADAGHAHRSAAHAEHPEAVGSATAHAPGAAQVSLAERAAVVEARLTAVEQQVEAAVASRVAGSLEAAVEARAKVQSQHAHLHQARAQFVGKMCGMLFSVLLGLACCAYLYKMCCGESSIWYTNKTILKWRLKAGLDKYPEMSVEITVHRARDMPSGSLQIAFLPRRGKPGKLVPKLGKKPFITAVSDDCKWEQVVKVALGQGHQLLQIGVFKKSLVGQPKLLGWDSLLVRDFVKPDAEPFTRKWVYIGTEDLQKMGSVNMSISIPEKTPRKDKPDSVDLEKAVTGPLQLCNEFGNFRVVFFKIEVKRDVYIWSWSDKKEGGETLGRLPVNSITAIHEVPNSISEFVVRYRDQRDKGVNLTLQRHERPREDWVRGLHALLEHTRKLRAKTRVIKSTDEERSTDKGTDDSAKARPTREKKMRKSLKTTKHHKHHKQASDSDDSD